MLSYFLLPVYKNNYKVCFEKLLNPQEVPPLQDVELKATGESEPIS